MGGGLPKAWRGEPECPKADVECPKADGDYPKADEDCPKADGDYPFFLSFLLSLSAATPLSFDPRVQTGQSGRVTSFD